MNLMEKKSEKVTASGRLAGNWERTEKNFLGGDGNVLCLYRDLGSIQGLCIYQNSVTIHLSNFAFRCL